MSLSAQTAIGAGTPDIRRRIFGIALPVMAEMFLQTFTQIVSMALVGHLGANAVASIGLSVQPLNMVYAVFMGISIGSTAIVSRAVGAGDHKAASHASAQSVTLACAAALGGGLLILVFARPMVRWMGAGPDVLDASVRYLTVMLPGLICMWVSTTLTGALRGAGDARTPMKVNIIINIINFAGNLLLVHGLLGFPALGTLGAGIATSSARVIGGYLLFRPYLKGNTVLQARFPSDLAPNREVLSRLWRVAFPGACERLIMTGGQLPYVRMIAALGTVPYAAHLIGINAESMSYMPGNGFSTAATTLTGQNLGAGRPDLAEQSTYQSVKLAVMFMGGMGLIMLSFPHVLLRVYTSDPDILRLGAVYLRIMAFNQIFVAIGFTFAGALRGAGDTRFVVYMTGFTVWIVRLGVSYLLVNHFKTGVVGAWWGMAADWYFRGILSFLWFRAGHWKHIRI